MLQASSNSKATSSDKVSTIPDKTKSPPNQRLRPVDSKTDDSSGAAGEIQMEGVDRQVLAERARQEERWGARTRELEGALARVEGELGALRGENEGLIAGGQKALAELKNGFEKAAKDWALEKEELNKKLKTVSDENINFCFMHTDCWYA